MEPKAVNTLVSESEELRQVTLSQLPKGSPKELESIFSDTSLFFDEEVLAKWRLEERFDELIDYILYQYGSQGGEVFWKQVLLDLRLKSDDERAFRLLEGLLPGRMDLYKSALKNSKKFPDNYLSSSNLMIAAGEVIKVLYEQAYILENRPADKVDKPKVKKVKTKIEKVLSFK